MSLNVTTNVRTSNFISPTLFSINTYIHSNWQENISQLNNKM
jgi:hypothetical protein